MSKMAKARTELERIADWLDDDEIGKSEAAANIRDVVDSWMHRNRGPRVPNVSTPMTVELGDQCRVMRTIDPYLSQGQISRELNINSGRVSEALAGYWSEATPRGPHAGEQ